jgi:photosystem II stability/assembly factor-like uncharacterized protein
VRQFHLQGDRSRRRGKRTLTVVLLGGLVALLGGSSLGLAEGRSSGPEAASVDPSLLQALEWRSIGPIRGGRSIAAAGSPARPNEYYFGATGGGLWKTTDGGTTWNPVSDGHFTSSSVGAVAVCEANPEVVYAGMGEVQFRNDIIQGDGVYKSTDGGRTWTHMGLEDSQTVSRIRIDPSDCDRVYAAVMGHAFGRNTERGVFRSTDGGESWRRVLYRNSQTGAADLVIDPNDPSVLYAGLWYAFRRPWTGWSGGPGGGLYKSTDGGDTWTNLTRNPGLPRGIIGKVGVSVSGADSNRVYAIIDARQPGVFASDDAGASWRKLNDEAAITQRPAYYTRLNADPRDRDTVYVLTDDLWKSTDGGRTFEEIDAPHADHHDLWIDPNNSERLINANDGGANVSVNGGDTWTEQDYSTAQMYHVMATNDVPYLVCGAQQDNSTACVPSDGTGDQFFSPGGGESGYIANDPRDSNVFYAGSLGGTLTRFDRRLPFQRRRVDVWPEVPFGQAPRNIRERFQWTFPIVTTPAFPNAVYASSQHLFRTTNEGQSWERISPDLTRADPETLGRPGGPIYKEGSSAETYATIFAVAPSPHDRRLMWVGSDDGLIHITRNGGRSWEDITPPDLERFTRVSIIEASPHDPGTAYVATNRYQLDDRTPYIYKTDDYGRSWIKIVNGIPDGDFVRVVREDPVRKGLLYAGTEHGVYVSLDDGESWQSLRQNLPDTSVQDLVVKDEDLVIATHGRGFYVMDDISPLRQLMPQVASDPLHLFDPTDARLSVDAGVTVTYLLTQPAGDAKLELLDGGRSLETVRAPAGAGAHRVLLKPGGPGSYTVRLSAGGQSDAQAVEVTAGPPRTDGAFAADLFEGAPTPARLTTQGPFQLFDPTDPVRLVDPGVTVSYLLAEPAEQISLDFLDSRGEVVRSFSGGQLPSDPGLNRFTWNLRTPGPSVFEGLVLLFVNPTAGPRVPWGTYAVRLTVDAESQTQSFEVKGDPRLTGVGPAAIREQFRLATEVRDRTSASHEAVAGIRVCRGQIQDRAEQAGDDEVTAAGERLAGELGAIERALYQTRLLAGDDEGHFPIKLNNKFAYLLPVIESAESRPTDQTYDVFDVLSRRLDRRLTALDQLFDEDVPAFNELLQNHDLEPISCSRGV